MMRNKKTRESKMIERWLEKECGLKRGEIPKEAVGFFQAAAREQLEDQQLDKKEYKKALDGMSMQELSVYIPDVYQKKIEDIDYAKLKEKGIRLISFDMDDAIGYMVKHNLMNHMPYASVAMPEYAKELFKKLREMGFMVVLLTHAPEEIAEGASKSLKADGYIAREGKTAAEAFDALRSRYGINGFEEMAHVGSSMGDDLAGGNQLGVTTCLIRRRGISVEMGKRIRGFRRQKTAGHIIREKLLAYGMWHKHHVELKDDPYYQIGEVQAYSANFRLYGCTEQLVKESNIGQEAAAYLIQKFEAEKENITFNLEDIRRNIYKQNESEGIKTLHRHLGKEILITALWKDAREDNEVEEADLLEGELSAVTFKIGSYCIRSSTHLYQDTAEMSYRERIPAAKERLAAYKENGRYALFSENEGIREVYEVWVKYQGSGDAAAGDWKIVCLATESCMGRWSESVDFIGTVKRDASASDEQEALFVQKTYLGDSFRVMYWYKITSDGTITEYHEDALNMASFDTPWEL